MAKLTHIPWMQRSDPWKISRSTMGIMGISWYVIGIPLKKTYNIYMCACMIIIYYNPLKYIYIYSYIYYIRNGQWQLDNHPCGAQIRCLSWFLVDISIVDGVGTTLYLKIKGYIIWDNTKSMNLGMLKLGNQITFGKSMVYKWEWVNLLGYLIWLDSSLSAF